MLICLTSYPVASTVQPLVWLLNDLGMYNNLHCAVHILFLFTSFAFKGQYYCRLKPLCLVQVCNGESLGIIDKLSVRTNSFQRDEYHFPHSSSDFKKVTRD